MNVLRMLDLDLAGKRVMIREDLNVPVESGAITSDARIRAALPTLRAALEKRARVIVLSHLGRPKEGEFSAENSLAPVARRLQELLGQPVRLETDWLDGVACEPGEVVLCENVRFNKGEKKDDESLSRRMAALTVPTGQTRVMSVVPPRYWPPESINSRPSPSISASLPGIAR